MLASFTTEPSPRVTFGANRLDRLGEDVERLAGQQAKVLLVTDPGVIAAGVAARVERILHEAGHATAIFSISPASRGCIKSMARPSLRARSAFRW